MLVVFVELLIDAKNSSKSILACVLVFGQKYHAQVSSLLDIMFLAN